MFLARLGVAPPILCKKSPELFNPAGDTDAPYRHLGWWPYPTDDDYTQSVAWRVAEIPPRFYVSDTCRKPRRLSFSLGLIYIPRFRAQTPSPPRLAAHTLGIREATLAKRIKNQSTGKGEVPPRSKSLKTRGCSTGAGSQKYHVPSLPVALPRRTVATY